MQRTFEAVNKIQVTSLVNLHTQVLTPLRRFEATIKEATAAINRVKKLNMHLQTVKNALVEARNTQRSVNSTRRIHDLEND